MFESDYSESDEHFYCGENLNIKAQNNPETVGARTVLPVKSN